MMVVQGEITVDFESQIEGNENSVYRKGKVIFFFLNPSIYILYIGACCRDLSFILQFNELKRGLKRKRGAEMLLHNKLF
jgi:hypothetical protein